jgi:hypothetical protein
MEGSSIPFEFVCDRDPLKRAPVGSDWHRARTILSKIGWKVETDKLVSFQMQELQPCAAQGTETEGCVRRPQDSGHLIYKQLQPRPVLVPFFLRFFECLERAVDRSAQVGYFIIASQWNSGREVTRCSNVVHA